MFNLIDESRVKESCSRWYNVLLDDFKDALFKEASNLFLAGGSKWCNLAVTL
jgi:hypothetical protein